MSDANATQQNIQGIEARIDRLQRGKAILKRLCTAFIEFSFYSSMRLDDIATLCWEKVNLGTRLMHICRTVAKKQVVERNKTKKSRYVLLNDRALHALQVAKAYAERRAKGKCSVTDPLLLTPEQGRGVHPADE